MKTKTTFTRTSLLRTLSTDAPPRTVRDIGTEAGVSDALVRYALGTLMQDGLVRNYNLRGEDGEVLRTLGYSITKAGRQVVQAG